MKRQVNVLLAFAGAAMLLGCTQDPVGMAPGGLEPSASSQRSERPDDASSGGESAQSEASGGSDAGGGSGGAN